MGRFQRFGASPRAGLWQAKVGCSEMGDEIRLWSKGRNAGLRNFQRDRPLGRACVGAAHHFDCNRQSHGQSLKLSQHSQTNQIRNSVKDRTLLYLLQAELEGLREKASEKYPEAFFVVASVTPRTGS